MVSLYGVIIEPESQNGGLIVNTQIYNKNILTVKGNLNPKKTVLEYSVIKIHRS